MSDTVPRPRASTNARALVALGDFEAIARDRMHPAAFDYVAGGSWDEVSLAENEAAWRRYRLRAARARGRLADRPVDGPPRPADGPAGRDRADGGPGPGASRRRGRHGSAAAAAGVPFSLSTTSCRSIEDVAAAAPDADRWFQLYVQATRP